MTIEFKGLRIRRKWDGVLEGELEIAGDYGNSRLNLTEDLCTSILAICADSITAAAAEIAEHMKSEAARIDVISSQAIESTGGSHYDGL